MELVEIVTNALENLWALLVLHLPRLLAALLILVVGWIVARVVRRGVRKLLGVLRVDELAEKAGVEDYLVQGGVRYTTVTILSGLVYWLLMFAVLLAALNALGLQIAAELLNRVVLYIPNVLAAILVLLFGSLLGRVVRGAVFTYLNNSGVESAAVISSLAHWAILIFAVFLGLEQLRIGGAILVSAFQIAFGAFCLALALAFGLGGRRWAAQVLERMWEK